MLLTRKANGAVASPIMLNGSCVAATPAPAVRPERLRNVRRSIVLASTVESPCASRD